MTDIDRAYEISRGLIINQISADGPFITGGPSSPIGLNLPVRTIYLRNDTSKVRIYLKFGNNNNDWRELSAQDVPFLTTGLTNSSPDLIGANDLQQAVTALADRDYGKDFAETTREDSQTVSGSTFVSRDTLNFTARGNGVNKYRVAANWTYSHDSASNDVRFQIFIDGSRVGPEVREEPKDRGGDQRFARSIVWYESNLSNGAHTFELRFRPATASRDTTVHYSNLEAWRVE